MRYNAFEGITPKLKRTATTAQVAHNVDLYGQSLRPLRSPAKDGEVVDVVGIPIKGAVTVYNAKGLWVGFDKHTWVIPDTNGPLEFERFLFVRDGKLWWQNASGVLAGRAPVQVGQDAPCDPPKATGIVGAGCTYPDIRDTCVTTPEKDCQTSPPILTAWVYTWVKYYGDCTWRYEESSPSPPTYSDVFAGDATYLTSGPIPAGVSAIRWYRGIAGTTGTVWLFAGETTTTSFTDNLCVEELGEPLYDALYAAPPACIDGVAVVGDAVTIVWHGRTFWASEEQKPHAYDIDSNTYSVPYDIVGVHGLARPLEGEMTYDANVLTKGKPYKVRGNSPNKLNVQEMQEWQPCLAATTICEIQGHTVYASPYGLIGIGTEEAHNLTDNYFTENEWQGISPERVRCAWWNGNVYMGFTDKDGYILYTDPNGGMRIKALTTHGVRVTAWHSAADTGLHLTSVGTSDISEWARGRVMWFKWRSQEVIQSGLWKPSAVKVVSEYPRRRYNEDKAYVDFMAWAMGNPQGDLDGFIKEHKHYAHLWTQMQDEPFMVVKVFRDNRLVYTRRHHDSRPLRIPRTVRGLEWSVQVEGNIEVREVHMQSSITDLSQDGGHA